MLAAAARGVMTKYAAVIVIEESRAEAALVCTALALHAPQMRVLEACDVQGAIELLGKESTPIGLAILGARAIRGAPQLIGALKRHGVEIPVIGIAPRVSGAERERAMAAGMQAIVERPREWKQYAEMVGELLTRID